MNTQVLAAVLLASTGLMIPVHAEMHTFIDDMGRPLDGELVSVAGDRVTIKRKADGRLLTKKFTEFSQADQVYFAIKGSDAPATPVKPPQVADKPPATAAGSSATTRTPPMHLEVRVFPAKKQISQKDTIDDTIQRVSYRVDIRNEERQRALAGAKATLLILAQNLNDASESIVIARDDFDVSLEPLKSTSLATKEVKLLFDERGYKYGYKYTGSFVLVVKDSDGKVIYLTPNNAPLAKSIEDVLKLKAEDVVDKNYKFLKKGYLRK